MAPAERQTSAPDNSFAGWPAMDGLGTFYELEVCCTGQPNPVTGYLINISAIDRAVRTHVIPLISDAVHHSPDQHPGKLLARVVPVLRDELARLRMAGDSNNANGNMEISVCWRLTPYYSVSMSSENLQQVLLSQQFEFAAAHRLHVDSLTDSQNQSVFGKCNNRNGHGHNYRIEPFVAVPLSNNIPPMTLATLERIVNQTIIQRFDHRHLNLDLPEFANVNPSVENIARVCFEQLAEPIKLAGGTLRRITVWETEKTSCTYPAGDVRMA